MKYDFEFDKVFGPLRKPGRRRFSELIQLVHQSALDGYNVCVTRLHGQTGSGKTSPWRAARTWTRKEQAGMIPGLSGGSSKAKAAEGVSWVYRLHASFLEIYNEDN